jgi:hypothetical protein
MARKNEQIGVSLDPDDFVASGSFGPGPATANKHTFAYFDYQGKGPRVPALLVTLERDGEESVESYTVGKGWEPSADGKMILAKGNQASLNPKSKAGLYISAMKDCGMPKGFITNDISVLDGVDGNMIVKPMEKIAGDDKDKSALIFNKVTDAPWNGSGSKSAAKASTSTKAKGKPAEADDDEDDLQEAAVEALIDALDDGPLKQRNVEDAILAVTKKNPLSKKIAALVESDDFLELEKGWTYDSKKGTITLDK